MFDLAAIQQSLCQFDLDGWLLYDFRGSNVLARRVLDMETKPVGTRRFFYFIPAEGEPTKLVHRIESAALDHLPGSKRVYLAWEDIEGELWEIMKVRPRVAMEYAKGISNPYISRVDAGTVEAVRGLNCEVVSSGDLVQQFEATWDDDQWRMHRQAEACTTAAYDLAWASSPSGSRRAGRSARPRSKGRSWITSIATG